MSLLALDIGTRHTGVAFFSEDIGMVIPLDTVHHQSFEELEQRVRTLIRSRGVQELVLGLPKLPSGEEGSQADIVRAFGARFTEIPVQYLDERYSTPTHPSTDGDAAAACTVLSLYLERTR